MLRRFHGNDHPFVANVVNDLGNLYRQQGAYDRAEPYLREAVRALHARFGDENLMVASARVDLADVLRARGAFAEAEPLLLAGYAALRSRRAHSTSDDRKQLALESLVKLYEAQGRESEAAKYRALMSEGGGRRAAGGGLR